MNTGINYTEFYDILLRLREDFHSYGRIDDSNAKLDEIIKIIALSYYEATQKRKFSLPNLRKFSNDQYGNPNNVAEALRFSFEKASHSDIFMNEDGTNIFGAHPTLNIQPSENLFAEKLISEIEKIDFINLLSNKNLADFDIINECFGHFVRENFRNNKEDAQYMTPSEITSGIVKMVFADMRSDNYLTAANAKDFTIMDPTCGVGTLLIDSSKEFSQLVNSLEISQKRKISYIKQFRSSGIIGQDKVDRMVRLSKMNTMLIGGNISNIFSGNSIMGDSAIDSYVGKIDFIFTNPPFGAEYCIQDISFDKFPMLKQLDISSNIITSELLMLIKSISLLKQGGYLAIVLPDSVFSSKGINAQIREILLNHYQIRAIVELPAVAFAQAGTRTKTSILYLKNSPVKKQAKIAMGICEDIGYIVKERTGVPVKILTDVNEVDILSRKYIENFSCGNMKIPTIINDKPSLTAITPQNLIDGILNPSFYAAERLATIDSLKSTLKPGIELKKLSEIAEFVTLTRKSYHTDQNTKHISVLHINQDFTVDFNEVYSFTPVCKGRECRHGDLLFSKINPRIPRMAVVPKDSYRLVCSNEFEILRTKGNIDPYTLCLIFKSPYVRSQIESLTSGTSSSHSRIKREQLEEILIPYPINDETACIYRDIGKSIECALHDKYAADGVIREQAVVLAAI